jgi:hypothetical protein
MSTVLRISEVATPVSKQFYEANKLGFAFVIVEGDIIFKHSPKEDLRHKLQSECNTITPIAL